MFVSIPSRNKTGLRWAVPLLCMALLAAFLWSISRPDEARRSLWLAWGALATGLGTPDEWWAALRDGSVLRLFTALFLHADWSHLLGNLVFLLIFGLPAERVLGPWRLMLLFLVGGAISNLTAIYTMGSPDQIIIGASGAVSALIGAYLALFPGARLGVVIPLGLFLEFVRAPAYLLIGVWAALQVVFAYIGPTFGMVAWWAHIAGFVFGLGYGVYVRAAIARRLRKRHGF
ncbi:MAG: rhomboid family intramembrane serine protease [Stenotrophomonas bentonitica]